MSAIASIRNSALVVSVLTLAACPNPGKSGDANKITAPNAETHDIYFPILTGKHGGIDCNTCHGEFDTFLQFNCLNGCHAANETDSHHSGMPGYEYNSNSCYACHPRGEADDIDHSQFFPIAATDTHGGIPCSTCHTDPTDRKKITCIGPGCHENPKTDGDHQGVDGYSYDSAACYSCHPDGKAEGSANHGAYFPIDSTATHTGIGCSTCHTTPGNRKVVTCADEPCHPCATMTSEHGVVGGYSYDSTLCLRCHADSQVDRVASHNPFGIRAGFPHNRGSCLVCHPGMRTDKAWATDFISLDCFASCHNKSETNSHHAEIAGYGQAPSDCLTCHPTGKNP